MTWKVHLLEKCGCVDAGVRCVKCGEMLWKLSAMLWVRPGVGLALGLGSGLL